MLPNPRIPGHEKGWYDPDGCRLGFCLDGETECRIDEAKAVSRETAAYLEGLELEKTKASTRGGSNIADGVDVTVKLCYPDGSEVEISLDEAVRKQLLQQLEMELIVK